MTHYLIEFRFQGKAKHEMRRLVYDVNRRYRVGKGRAIPHISLAGPLRTRNQRRLVRDFRRLCEKYPLMKFKIKGFGTFKDTRVVYINIDPSEKLDEFRWEIAKTIKDYCTLRPHDYKRNFEYHATIAMKLSHDKFKRIKSYIQQQKPMDQKYLLARVTLIKNSRILYEYDFLQRRMLNRREALSRRIGARTKKLLDDYFAGKHDPNKHIDRTTEIRVPKRSFWHRIKDYFAPPRVFIASDLHLQHGNVIRFCKRPFKNASQMNEVLVKNWNQTVRKKDTVYFLGDLVYTSQLRKNPEQHKRRYRYWLRKLNGKIIVIRGNHEPKNEKNILDKYILKTDDEEILLIHDDKDIPSDWKEWTIHGHHHNNHPQEFPLVHKHGKRINASIELTDYKPIPLDKLLLMRK